MLLSSQLQLIIFIFIFAWLGGITFFGVRFLRFFKSLTKGSSEKDLKSLLTEILQEIKIVKEEKAKILERVEKQEEEGHFHFQKVGLVRYNPFSDTGGDQSFVLALLDGNDDGIVITSLHSRDQTRIFTKPVLKGKQLGYEFSKEEIEAVVRAKKGKAKK